MVYDVLMYIRFLALIVKRLTGVDRISTLCLKKTSLMLPHYNFSAHQPILAISAELLLTEYAIEW